jgi:hypothetical protein
MLGMYLSFEETAKQFFKVFVPFSTPPSSGLLGGTPPAYLAG